MKKAPFWTILMFFALVMSPALAADWCRPNQAPHINVQTSTDQIGYDYSRSEKDLNNFDITTVNPYGNNVITDVGGLMKGGIMTQQQMSFGIIANPNVHQSCLWYDTINVSIHIRPTIFIAREFKQGTCMHNSIMQHEMKHVTADRLIVNKYADLIGQALRDDAAKYPVFGPVATSEQEKLVSMIKERLQKILTHYTTQMSAERKELQQQIDSLSEYERVNKSCK